MDSLHKMKIDILSILVLYSRPVVDCGVGDPTMVNDALCKRNGRDPLIFTVLAKQGLNSW